MERWWDHLGPREGDAGGINREDEGLGRWHGDVTYVRIRNPGSGGSLDRAFQDGLATGLLSHAEDGGYQEEDSVWGTGWRGVMVDRLLAAALQLRRALSVAGERGYCIYVERGGKSDG